MREVEVSRFIAATVPELERHLSPTAIIEYEGTFTVTDVAENDAEWIVTGDAGGMSATFAFERRENGYRYVQRGSRGPFETMETTLNYDRENEGSVVSVRSSVSLGLPLSAVTDRVAAWKRRGELKRALRRLAADVE